MSYNDLKFKWILGTTEVENGQLEKVILCAKCIFHKELKGEFESVKGGGEWYFDRENKEILLYGESHDFGRASIEDIKSVIARNQIYQMRLVIGKKFDVSEYKFFFSESCYCLMLNKIKYH